MNNTKRETWLINVDIFKYNLFGYIKQQLCKGSTNDVVAIWGIEDKNIENVRAGQDAYFYITGIGSENEKKNPDYMKFHFLKKFAFKGEIVEVTGELPKDDAFWNRETDIEKRTSYSKYAHIKITEDYTDLQIMSDAINWKPLMGKGRRMYLLTEENIERLEEATRRAKKCFADNAGEDRKDGN